MNLTNLVKNNKKVKFYCYRQGFFYYSIEWTELGSQGNIDVYTFPVPIDDIGTATMLAEDKSITFMRWIRKAIEDKTFIKIS